MAQALGRRKTPEGLDLPQILVSSGDKNPQKAESQGRKQSGPCSQGRPSPCSLHLKLSGVNSGKGVLGLTESLIPACLLLFPRERAVPSEETPGRGLERFDLARFADVVSPLRSPTPSFHIPSY